MKRSGYEVKQLAGYKAFIPSMLPVKPKVSISDKLLKDVEVALAKLDAVSAAIPNPQLFLSMYVRKEALLSSQIEGTQATFEDVLTYETWEDVENFDDVEEVVNYIKALNHGVKRLGEFPMSLRVIKEIHEILMTGVRGSSKTPGRFRVSQNWIGPGGLSLKAATFVPVPPDQMLDFLSNLEKYMHKNTTEHPLIQCALIHYQFETIHPFLDGNGRVGRLLIVLFLLWKNLLKSPLLYPSCFFKLYKQEYFDRLSLVRVNGDFEQWIEFFLKGIIEAANQALSSISSIVKLQNELSRVAQKMPSRSSKRMDYLDTLFISPVFDVKSMAEKISCSFQTSSDLTKLFVKHGIIEEISGKMRYQRYAFSSYLNILES